MKLTASCVAALMLPEGKTDHIEWDESLPGFGVRLRGNSKHYIIQYRVGSQQRRESLGDIRKIRWSRRAALPGSGSRSGKCRGVNT